MEGKRAGVGEWVRCEAMCLCDTAIPIIPNHTHLRIKRGSGVAAAQEHKRPVRLNKGRQRERGAGGGVNEGDSAAVQLMSHAQAAPHAFLRQAHVVCGLHEHGQVGGEVADSAAQEAEAGGDIVKVAAALALRHKRQDHALLQLHSDRRLVVARLAAPVLPVAAAGE